MNYFQSDDKLFSCRYCLVCNEQTRSKKCHEQEFPKTGESPIKFIMHIG